MPTFTLNGRNLVHFGVFKEHIGFYPLPKELVNEELAPTRRPSRRCDCRSTNRFRSI